MPIDLTAYTGYLRPWLSEIIQHHRAGMPPSDIAKRLRHELVARGYPYGTESTTIVYVLRRIGLIVENPKYSARYAARQAKRLAARRATIANWLRPPPPDPPDPPDPGRGRPLDMGGPRDVWLERSPWDAL